MNEQFSCSICEDGVKLEAGQNTCSACGRQRSAQESFFEGGEDSLAASMDQAFDGIVLEPAKKDSVKSQSVWWYVNNGRRIGPVSREELEVAVRESPEPINVLIWNEGFSNWRRYGEVSEFESVEQTSAPRTESIEEIASSDELDPQAGHKSDTDEGSVSSVLSDLPEIEEDTLEPEGLPIDDWSPSAAHTLRGLGASETAPIESDTWDEEGDDIGLPPSVDTAEFKRDEVFAHATQKSGPSPLMVGGVAFLLALGAYLVGYQFWTTQAVEPQPERAAVPERADKAIEDEPAVNNQMTPLPPTSIQSTVPSKNDAVPDASKPLKRASKKKRRPKKVTKLPATLTDTELERQLKKKSTSLAPCIEGAVSAKELPAGRHVMSFAYDILPSGRVSSASLLGPKYLVGGSLSRCVESTISGWRFPKTAKGREVRGQELAFRARAP